MEILGIGLLLSKGPPYLTDETMLQLFEKVYEQFEIDISSEERERLGSLGRFQTLMVEESDFELITSAGDRNVVMYLAKYVLGIDEHAKFKVTLKTRFLVWEKWMNPWGKKIYACCWLDD